MVNLLGLSREKSEQQQPANRYLEILDNFLVGIILLQVLAFFGLWKLGELGYMLGMMIWK